MPPHEPAYGFGGDVAVRGFLALLAIAMYPGSVRAEPCDTALRRDEAIAALKNASEAWPVHVQFATRAPGVKLATGLLDKHPETMTIILQHQFDKLRVGNDRFEVGLWFNGRYRRVAVPFDAVIGFWNKGVELCGPGERRISPPAKK